MIKYRPHRGALADAMSEAREFETVEQMKEFVAASFCMDGCKPAFGVEDIVIGEMLGDDKRIGWKNVRHVCVKRYMNDDFMEIYGSPQCIGWCGE